VVDEINYLGVTFECSGGWNRQTIKAIAKGNQTLVAIDKCLARTPDIRVKIQENGELHSSLTVFTAPFFVQLIGPSEIQNLEVSIPNAHSTPFLPLQSVIKYSY
jgi:hypothetical protein